MCDARNASYKYIMMRTDDNVDDCALYSRVLRYIAIMMNALSLG